MINEGEIFDINRTRHWLEIQRMRVAIPSIEMSEALLVT